MESKKATNTLLPKVDGNELEEMRGISDHQFCFRRGKSTVGAIQHVLDSKMDARNAFNTAVANSRKPLT